MAVPVLTAVTGVHWEADLVAALDRTSAGIRVVRRCVDVADLLSAAASGTARAVLLSPGLRRLDREVLSRLSASGVAVVGVVMAADEEGERRLRQLGVEVLVSPDAGAERVAAAVLQALEMPRNLPGGAAAGMGAAGMGAAGVNATAVGAAGVSALHAAEADADEPADTEGLDDAEPLVEPGTGRLVAVWGPTGAPGRTTVAVNVATELAALRLPALLADADTYGGVVAQVLGLLDEAPGLAAAARLANTGSLDLPALARFARRVDGTGLRVLTGITRADRWPELRPSSLEVVWRLARTLAAFTVVDCGFSLEQDEEIAFDTAAPRRNGATLATLEAADVILAVGAADPVGVQRLVRGLAELGEAVPGVDTRVVITRVRRGPVGPDPERQLAAVLDRFAGVTQVCFIPDDRAACDHALAAGRTLLEVAPDSPARLALAALAAQLAGRTSSTRPRRRWRRPAGLRPADRAGRP